MGRDSIIDVGCICVFGICFPADKNGEKLAKKLSRAKVLIENNLATKKEINFYNKWVGYKYKKYDAD